MMEIQLRLQSIYIKGTNEIRPDGTVMVELIKWAGEDVKQALMKQILLTDMNGSNQGKEQISREEVFSMFVRGLAISR